MCTRPPNTVCSAQARWWARRVIRKRAINCEGARGRLPWDEPAWHKDYYKFELRERWPVRGPTDPSVPLIAGNKSPMWEVPSLSQEGDTSQQRWEISSQEGCHVRLCLPTNYYSGPNSVENSLLIEALQVIFFIFFNSLQIYCLRLKSIKAAYLGHLFGCPFHYWASAHGISLCFSSLHLPHVNFILSSARSILDRLYFFLSDNYHLFPFLSRSLFSAKLVG